MKALSFALALIMLATAPAALALSATQRALKEIVTTTPSGDIETRYVEAKLVVPGETIVYRIDYMNDSDAPVTDLVLTMPVPAEVTFQEGSAEQDGMETYFSTDDGQSFTNRTDLRVDMGGGIMAPAGSEDITHVRWVSIRPVPAEADGLLQFKAVLK
ncbi:hypothetical protein GCM10009069_30100 [Algimonas arctica]|uniref:DUF11 domain-containing protein n=1 Tax=Algimonas arctica TaxID=1479486 RepID=A0A8J3CUV7_9PROT|nr:DUF11 domain-containing protein [Algimonas arctica]GHB05673.1 hypothetical protein GCM10009069_30100 [Algimonas arctica]